MAPTMKAYPAHIHNEPRPVNLSFPFDIFYFYIYSLICVLFLLYIIITRKFCKSILWDKGTLGPSPIEVLVGLGPHLTVVGWPTRISMDKIGDDLARKACGAILGSRLEIMGIML